jgi:hypothetical protein
MKQRLKHPRGEGTQKRTGQNRREKKEEEEEEEEDHTTMTTKRLCNSLQLKSISS